MPDWLAVALGGAAGSMSRYYGAALVQQATASTLPVGTLTVNLVGSFLLGVLVAMGVERDWFSDNARLLLTTGFCGGFTTMSTFSVEVVSLFQTGAFAPALGYAAMTGLGCTLCAAAGILLTRSVV